MNVTEQQTIELIRKGEGLDLEFKTCRNQLNRDVYETVCAFLNRHGGTLFLGVQDNGVIQGIAPDAVAQIRKDFVTAINNPQKISPPTYLGVDEVTVADKTLLRIYVPESSQVHRCNGRIYDRNEDGDLDITDHTAQVAQLYQRKQVTYTENKVFPHLGLDDLDRDLIARCRKIATLRWENHPWKDLDDLELLQSAQLYQTDPETGKSGITRAGILLLEKQLPLLQAVPHHRTENSSRPHGFGRLDPENFTPFPKNPVIARFFRQIGRADELGSGMRKMMKYSRAYGGADPELVEGDVFRMIVKVPEFGEKAAPESRQVPGKYPASTGQVTGQVEEWVINVLSACADPQKSAKLQEITGIKHRETFQRNYLDRLLEKGLIVRTIPDKPQSRMQKYIITEKGKKVLENHRV